MLLASILARVFTIKMSFVNVFEVNYGLG